MMAKREQIVFLTIFYVCGLLSATAQESASPEAAAAAEAEGPPPSTTTPPPTAAEDNDVAAVPGHTRPVPPEPDRQVRYAELMTRLETGDIQLIDVRNRSEIAELGKIPGALNIPLRELQTALDLSPLQYKVAFGRRKPRAADENIVFTCRTLRRSGIATRIARRMGYTKARYYIGGWKGWAKTRTDLGLPVMWGKRVLRGLEPVGVE